MKYANYHRINGDLCYDAFLAYRCDMFTSAHALGWSHFAMDTSVYATVFRMFATHNSARLHRFTISTQPFARESDDLLFFVYICCSNGIRCSPISSA